MRWSGPATCALVLSASPPAAAFCGFYVSGADAKLFNDASMVVLARDGTHTVLSMQNNYKGPLEDFAMVVPVPVVLSEETVKTLPREIFDRIDTFAAPRLVEYWEQDPCAAVPEGGIGQRAKPLSGSFGIVGPAEPDRYGVVIEAEFVAGEYQIVILGAEDSMGLDRWLRDHGYRIPEGAEPILRPYVQAGSKFFVAKVDVDEVRMDADGAVLSPLRFEYDDEAFRLPVRLGLLNSAGTQDLIVHVVAKDRYEVANYENVFVPTNVEVAEAARTRFGELYAALFDATLAGRPRAVVTEYAWDIRSCDPCPTPALGEEELRLLGARPDGVLTRLHARYTRGSLGEDLVFRAAPPVTGGREERADSGRGAQPARSNAFQARYVVRHRWQGAVDCAAPRFGVWGEPTSGSRPAPVAAKDLASAERGGVALAALVREPLPELGVTPAADAAPDGRRRFFLGLGAGAAAGLAASVALLLRLRRRPAERAG